MFMFRAIKDQLRFRSIPVDMIMSGDFDIRDREDNNDIKDLAQNIKDHGLLSPILVKKLANDMHEIISGHRRYLAAKQAGLSKIFAIVFSEEEEKKLLIYFLSENLHHRSLDFFEEADAMFKLIYEYGFTQEMILESLNVSHFFIADRLQLLKIGASARAKIRQYKLTVDHALLISRLELESKQLYVIDKVIKDKIGIYQLKALIDEIENSNFDIFKKTNTACETIYIIKDIRLFDNTISQALDVMNRSGVRASSIKNESEDSIEYIIKIPKNKVSLRRSVGF